MNRIKNLLLILMTFRVVTINGQTKDNPKMIMAIDPIQSHMLCVGVDNPIKIAISDIPNDKVQVFVDNGNITGSNGEYSIRPEKIAPCEITIQTKGQIIEKRIFKVMANEAPLNVQLAGKTSGDIELNQILTNPSFNIYFSNSDFYIVAEMKEFRFITIIDDKVKDIKATGGTLNSEIIKLLNKLSSGSEFFIQGIKVKCSDGQQRDVPSMCFKLK
jgi:hypothetical protein